MDHLTSGTHLFRTRREHFCTLPGSSPTLNNAWASLCACACMFASTNRSSRWCECFFSSSSWPVSSIHYPGSGTHISSVSVGDGALLQHGLHQHYNTRGEKTSTKSLKHNNQEQNWVTGCRLALPLIYGETTFNYNSSKVFIYKHLKGEWNLLYFLSNNQKITNSQLWNRHIVVQALDRNALSTRGHS